MSTVWDRIKLWASASDEDKIQLDRRAFLTGMAVTSAGLLVPNGAMFDMGRVVKPDAWETLIYGSHKQLECVDWNRFSSTNNQQLVLRRKLGRGVA